MFFVMGYSSICCPALKVMRSTQIQLFIAHMLKMWMCHISGATWVFLSLTSWQLWPQVLNPGPFLLGLDMLDECLMMTMTIDDWQMILSWMRNNSICSHTAHAIRVRVRTLQGHDNSSHWKYKFPSATEIACSMYTEPQNKADSHLLWWWPWRCTSNHQSPEPAKTVQN